MPSVTKDTLEITNNILECLSIAYPTFDLRFTDIKRLNNKETKKSKE